MHTLTFSEEEMAAIPFECDGMAVFYRYIISRYYHTGISQVREIKRRHIAVGYGILNGWLKQLDRKHYGEGWCDIVEKGPVLDRFLPSDMIAWDDKCFIFERPP